MLGRLLTSAATTRVKYAGELGVMRTSEGGNRFNGFHTMEQTVETVLIAVAFKHPAEASVLTRDG